jgi:hypothetical protein
MLLKPSRCRLRGAEEVRVLQPTLRKLARSRAATMDTTANGDSAVSIPAGVTSMCTGSPVPRHGDSMLARRPKRTGKCKASSAHQANRERSSSSKRCGVRCSVKPGPTTLPCSSRSALGNRSSAARTSSGNLSAAAAISSGDAGLFPANRSIVGGTISRKALPAVALIGAVIRAASSWRSLVLIGHLLSRLLERSVEKPIVVDGARHRGNHSSLGSK